MTSGEDWKCRNGLAGLRGRGIQLPYSEVLTSPIGAIPLTGPLQKFASVHANVHNHFNLEHHLIDRQTYKERSSAALAEWGSLVS